MKQIIDLIPVVAFVAVYFTTGDIFISTGVLMVGLAIQLAYEYLVHKQVDKKTKVVFWIAMVFGAATLLFRNEVFIQWKPTVVNWIFAGALIAGHFFGEKNLIEKFLGSQLDLPAKVWRNLNMGWALGFFVAGVLNLVVAFYFSLDVWVTYKLVGGALITTAYVIATIVYLIKGGYLKEEISEAGEVSTPTTNE
jgi:intracellular septation protein